MVNEEQVNTIANYINNPYSCSVVFAYFLFRKWWCSNSKEQGMVYFENNNSELMKEWNTRKAHWEDKYLKMLERIDKRLVAMHLRLDKLGGVSDRRTNHTVTQ